MHKVDEIAFAQVRPSLMREEFQTWKLIVNPETRSAALDAADGGATFDKNGRPVYKAIYQKRIPYTDFLLEETKLYCCANGDGPNGKTIMLPCEY